MFDRELPARPNLEQYKKQAKELVRDCALSVPAALERIKRHHPRLHKLSQADIPGSPFALADAQLILAREHGFESWPKFAKHIETTNLIRLVASLDEPVSAFIEVACVPRHASHISGTLEHAEMILERYPHVAGSNIYTAAILADETAVRGFLKRASRSAIATGGPHDWDALTCLCFSRYLRLDASRSEAFVRTAHVLLDAGASAKTGWYEMIDHPDPRPIFENVVYGAAAIARHPGLTRLLLERGADPNDEETPYHVPESYDNAVMNILLDSGTLNQASLTTMLLRKADVHDQDGLSLLLQRGADPNAMTRWGYNALQQALRRDNSLTAIEALLDHGADPALTNAQDGRSAMATAAYRGRGDVLRLVESRNLTADLQGVDRLTAACAKADDASIGRLSADDPRLVQDLLGEGGTLLAEFAGNGNVEGMRRLLALGVGADALYKEGDPYFDIAKDSTALHVAAWRAWPSAVKLLIESGAPVNVLDRKGRMALALAVKACVDSYWQDRRSPESVEALLKAGASISAIELPAGYDAIDQLLLQYRR
jgi:ankyrin repeat protein